MTLRYLLDTSIVSVPMMKTPHAGIVRRLETHGHESAIAAVVWHELTFGCRRLPRGRRRDALESYLHEVVRPSFPILAYDEAAATWHAHERARLEALGRPAPFVDGQIAAVAHANGLALVTLNVADFSPYEGLTVTNWSRKAPRAEA